MHLFLDTNVYLGFYKLTGDDLEELEKLVVAVRSGQTTLYTTKQLRDEFRRNRETVIAESLKAVEDSQLRSAFPRLLQNYPEYEELRNSLTAYEEHRGSLLKTVRSAADDRNLHADQLIDELFTLGNEIARTPEIWEAARERSLLGNPPGKKGSLGDAVNWESLLATIPVGEDLLFVSSDTDYMSKLDPSVVAEFLREEWSSRKSSQVVAYQNLTSLFRAHYPEIRLAAELEKELEVAKLVRSESFLQTHNSISELSAYTDFSPEQAQALIDAANRNTQIYWIRDDPDVRSFMRRIAEDHADHLTDDQLNEFWHYFGDAASDANEEYD